MADLTDVTVPDIGDFSDVPVIEVLVEAGATVAAEDPLVTLESDKATMDVPSPVAGVVEELLLQVGDTASEGTLVARVRVDGEASGDAEEAGVTSPDDTDAGSQARPEAAAERSVETAIAAESAAEGDSADDVPEVKEPARDEEVAAKGGAAGDDAPPYASPSVRRLARELDVDLSGVEGSGRKGRIVPEDVRAAKEGGAPAAAGAPAPAASLPSARVEEGDERVALTRIQQRSAANLGASWPQIPLVTQFDEADITDLEAFRKQVNAEQSDVKVTMVALLMKACAAALDAFPRFASSLDGDHLVLKKARHIGFAADTPNGLVVPVIRDVDHKGILDIAADLTDLSGKARSGKLSPREMSGAVFTISSLGGIGGTAFTPLVNPPQVAILGVSRSATKPVWDGAQFVPRLLVPLSLSYDHRVIDGAEAARFTVHLGKVLSDLRRVLL